MGKEAYEKHVKRIKIIHNLVVFLVCFVIGGCLGAATVVIAKVLIS